ALALMTLYAMKPVAGRPFSVTAPAVGLTPPGRVWPPSPVNRSRASQPSMPYGGIFGRRSEPNTPDGSPAAVSERKLMTLTSNGSEDGRVPTGGEKPPVRVV